MSLLVLKPQAGAAFKAGSRWGG